MGLTLIKLTFGKFLSMFLLKFFFAFFIYSSITLLLRNPFSNISVTNLHSTISGFSIMSLMKSCTASKELSSYSSFSSSVVPGLFAVTIRVKSLWQLLWYTASFAIRSSVHYAAILGSLRSRLASLIHLSPLNSTHKLSFFLFLYL